MNSAPFVYFHRRFRIRIHPYEDDKDEVMIAVMAPTSLTQKILIIIIFTAYLPPITVINKCSFPIIPAIIR